MSKRINLYKVAPEGYAPMIALEKYIAQSGLDKKLYHLIKTRASQINGCHYCINMHTKEAMAEGETAQRLFLLDAWWEVPELFTEKEQAAIALTEAMTLVAQGGVPDDVYEEAAKHFEEKQLAALMMGIVAINGWNRMAIATEMPLD